MSQTDTFNTSFIRTRYGIIRIIQLVVTICALISMGSGHYCGHGGKYGFYDFVAVSCLIFLIIFFVMMILRLDKYLTGCINLPLSFLINDAIFTILYLIAAILLFTTLSGGCYGRGARIAASIFGVLGFLSFVAITIDDYNWYKSGNAPITLTPTSGTVQPA